MTLLKNETTSPSADELDQSTRDQLYVCVARVEPLVYGARTDGHLSLKVYFSNQRVFGLEMYVSRFYERMKSSDPRMRPHTSLLNAIVGYDLIWHSLECRG